MNLPTGDWARIAFEASLNGSTRVGGIISIPPIPEINQQPCDLCRDIGLRIPLVERTVELAQPYELELWIGTVASLRYRSTSCQSCRSIVIACSLTHPHEEDINIRLRVTRVQPRVRITYEIYPQQFLQNGVVDAQAFLDPHRQVQSIIDFNSPHAFEVEQPVARGYHPNGINLDVLRSWISCCDQSHGTACLSPTSILPGGVSFSPPMLKLIDVERACVVPGLIRARYVALSYVWGQSPMVKASRDNIEALMREGSLSGRNSEIVLPRTIRDAIHLVSELREKYLWIDSLCVIQDDELDLQLNAMASIYAGATFTLVIAGGNDAGSGISGILGNAQGRDTACKTLAFPPTTLTRSIRRVADLDISDWARRAWTFQEGKFSRRLLIMNGPSGLASWICQRAEWREEEKRATEHYDWAANNQQIVTQQTSFMGFRAKFPSWPDIVFFGDLVSDYTARSLTYKEDILNAFRGTLNVLQASFASEFYHGLPGMFFDLALLWQPADGISRRQCQDGRSVYPSWSWIGWVGGISYGVLKGYSASWLLSLKQLPICFMSVTTICGVNLDGSRRPICDAFYDNSRTHPESQEPPPGWSRQRNNNGRYYTHPLAANLEFRYPLPRPTVTTQGSPNTLLYFHTERAWLTLGEIHPRTTPRLPLLNQSLFESREVDLTDSRGNLAGILTANLVASDTPPTGERCELIAISRGYIFNPDAEGGMFKRAEVALSEWHDRRRPKSSTFYHFFNVLWIEWRDGIAYRKALGRVFKEAWYAQFRESVYVTLG